jgi:hypothetical protein
MATWLREQSLSLALACLFVVSLVLQAWTGWYEERDEQLEHGASPPAFTEWITSGPFVEATFENWESEFLQMAVFLVLGATLYQRGSAESRPLEGEEPKTPLGPDSPAPARRGGWQRAIYARSLSLAFFALFLASFGAHAAGSVLAYNEDAALHGERSRTLGEHLGSSQFWFESFQNWQSEFLAVLAMVVLSIWLRQDGSPESKDVNAPHRETGT